MRRPVPIVVVVVVVGAALVVALVRWSASEGEGKSGTGLTYGGQFYLLSSAEVRDDALGSILERDVPFQDTAVDVRRIRGVDPKTALAAYTNTFPGTGSTKSAGWLLLSPNEANAADPWASDELRPVVVPPAPR